MITWKTEKDRETGYTIVEVSNGKHKLTATVTPYKAKRMTQKEFKRLIESLTEALELYES